VNIVRGKKVDCDFSQLPAVCSHADATHSVSYLKGWIREWGKITDLPTITF
jgi:hypothetical protein